MIKKKIVMLGAFAVGKTSLVQRYVNQIFSEKYLTTIGVKIDQKDVTVNDTDVRLMVWDLYGDDDFMKVKASYLIGASGYILVADGTREETIDIALQLHELAKNTTDNAPFILLINKYDLEKSWEVPIDVINKLKLAGWHVFYTSAKNDIMVDETFELLTTLILTHENNAP